MKKLFAPLILLFIIGFYFQEFNHENSKIQNSSYLLRDFSFKNVRENKIEQISEHRNDLLLINFWASWCKYCVMELPLLTQLAENNPRISIVLISTDKNLEAVNKIALRYSKIEKNLVWGHDPNREISHGIFNSVAMPETFIFDGEMRFLGKITGLVSEKKLHKFTKNL